MRVSIDLANGVPTIPCNAMSISLLSVTNSDDALRIAIPGKIVNSAIDDAVFTLGDTITDAVPDSYYTASITASDVETRWGKAGDCGCALMLCVLSGYGGVIDGPHEDRFVRLQLRCVSITMRFTRSKKVKE